MQSTCFHLICLPPTAIKTKQLRFITSSLIIYYWRKLVDLTLHHARSHDCVIEKIYSQTSDKLTGADPCTGEYGIVHHCSSLILNCSHMHRLCITKITARGKSLVRSWSAYNTWSQLNNPDHSWTILICWLIISLDTDKQGLQQHLIRIVIFSNWKVLSNSYWAVGQIEINEDMTTYRKLQWLTSERKEVGLLRRKFTSHLGLHFLTINPNLRSAKSVWDMILTLMCPTTSLHIE